MPASFTRRAALSMTGLGLLAACAPAASTPASAPAAAAPALAKDARITAVGQFTGASNHETRGTARVARSEGQWLIELGEDFFHDGAPDPKVALGADGFREEAILAPLASLSGQQVYALKSGLNIGNYNEVWIWCQQFSVPLGVAKLELV
ncbi:MAG: DM13 domain-containing protein [Pseudomonadota bacterium]